MDLQSIILDLEDEKITFEDKISLTFVIIGAIFFGLIVIALVMNALNFEQMEFDAPFF
ncbi:MAG TPA: hypothetical protein VMV49_08135 [Candidatus Deferrimicrobium sp.]|nr:hypothetical protein [Candidatus Deferrimicrobium sp.]